MMKNLSRKLTSMGWGIRHLGLSLRCEVVLGLKLSHIFETSLPTAYLIFFIVKQGFVLSDPCFTGWMCCEHVTAQALMSPRSTCVAELSIDLTQCLFFTHLKDAWFPVKVTLAFANVHRVIRSYRASLLSCLSCSSFCWLLDHALPK